MLNNKNTNRSVRHVKHFVSDPSSNVGPWSGIKAVSEAVDKARPAVVRIARIGGVITRTPFNAND